MPNGLFDLACLAISETEAVNRRTAVGRKAGTVDKVSAHTYKG